MLESPNNDWEIQLQKEFQRDYYLALRHFLQTEYQTQTIYPNIFELYTALELTAFSDTRVVILGQDPYHGAGQAHGLSFSVKAGVSVPPSLQNIYKELRSDLGCSIPKHGHLVHWAEQGVLLLNRVLTVRAGHPNSHQGKGWETFTDAIIQRLNQRMEPVVFVLWGTQARQLARGLDKDKHLVLESPHPSPLSAHRGFFGSKPFSKTNAFLRSIGGKEIDWQIPNE